MAITPIQFVLQQMQLPDPPQRGGGDWMQMLEMIQRLRQGGGPEQVATDTEPQPGQSTPIRNAIGIGGPPRVYDSQPSTTSAWQAGVRSRLPRMNFLDFLMRP